MNCALLVKEKMKAIKQELIEHYTYLHQHPELSFQEFNTTTYIKNELTRLGIEITDMDSSVGVVGLLHGTNEGPCVALRADIDGLPIQEQSSCLTPSLTDSVSHTCGHDGHIACLLGAARILSQMTDCFCGTIKFIFQPAEEGSGGAEYFAKKGCMEAPHVDAIFGLHNAPTVKSGFLGLKTGGIMAAVHKFKIILTGKGGHGAIPESNIDSIVAASSIIQGLQTITSRNVPPTQASVVSVCSIHAGDGLTFNVNPEVVEMAGTCRCYSKEMEQLIERRFKEIVTQIAAAYQVQAQIDYIPLHSAVINDEALYPYAVETANALSIPYIEPTPSTAGDDFSTFADYAPAYFFWLGNYNKDKDTIYPLHSPKFKIDTDTLSIGAGIYAMSALSYLNHIK